MPLYTLVVTDRNGQQQSNVVEFTSDDALLGAAHDALSDDHPSIAIARGSGADLEFLGAWDRDEGGEPRWTPGE